MQDSHSTGGKLTEALAPIIDKALETAERTGEFAIEQAPLVLQEFYMWYTAQFIFFMGVGVLVLLISFVFAIVARKSEESGWYVPSVIAFVVGAVIILHNAYDLIYITVAPRLFIIEHFINLSR